MYQLGRKTLSEAFPIHQLQKLPRKVKTKTKCISLYLHLKQAAQTTESFFHLLSINKAFSSKVWRWLINQPTIFYIKCLQKEKFRTETLFFSWEFDYSCFHLENDGSTSEKILVLSLVSIVYLCAKFSFYSILFFSSEDKPYLVFFIH